MNLWDILILLAIAVLLFLAVRTARKGRSGCCSAGCPGCTSAGCSSCGSNCTCSSCHPAERKANSPGSTLCDSPSNIR
ncbi:MAG: hypothetical protein IJ237_11435 [Oscillospiraceae bacterium]|nr:hypothetical protein [Oscillospiraceae bacterium]